MQQDRKKHHEFVKAIGLFDGTMIVVGSMIGSGIFHRRCRYFPTNGLGRRIAADLGADGFVDDCSGAFLWRIGGAVSACRRAIHLFAGSVLAAVGISVWLDAVPGDSDGHDRGGGHRVCAVSGRFVSRHSRQTWVVAPINLGSRYAISLSVQQLVAILMIIFLTFLNTRGVKTGEVDSEYIYLRKDAVAAGIDPSLRAGRAELGRDCG